jgi:polyisoprenoid-binding protein YceI
MKNRLAVPCLAALLLVGAAAPAAAEFNQVLTEKSRIGFVSKQMNVPVEGAFRRFKTQVAFDPAKPEAGRAQIEIDLGSIDTGSSESDEEVKRKGWFNIQAFPTAKFESTAVRALGGNRYELAGKLTIKGATRDVVAPFTYKPDGANGLFEGGFTLKRLEFKIGEGAWSDVGTVADEVQVRFKFLVAASAQKK